MTEIEIGDPAWQLNKATSEIYRLLVIEFEGTVEEFIELLKKYPKDTTLADFGYTERLTLAFDKDKNRLGIW